MKIAEGFVLKKIIDQNVVVPLGKRNVNFNTMISLNDSGAFLWEQLQTEKTEEELLAAMLDEYDIDEAKASEGIKVFIGKLKDAKLLE